MDQCPKCNAPPRPTADPGWLRKFRCMSGIRGAPYGFEFVQSLWCKEVEDLRAIVGPLEELLAARMHVGVDVHDSFAVVSAYDWDGTGDCYDAQRPTLAEALDAANTARKASHDPDCRKTPHLPGL